ARRGRGGRRPHRQEGHQKILGRARGRARWIRLGDLVVASCAILRHPRAGAAGVATGAAPPAPRRPRRRRGALLALDLLIVLLVLQGLLLVDDHVDIPQASSSRRRRRRSGRLLALIGLRRCAPLRRTEITQAIHPLTLGSGTRTTRTWSSSSTCRK